MSKRCQWLAVPQDKDGISRVRKSYVYRCEAPEPDLPDLPASITRCYGFQWPPGRQYMTAKDCLSCPWFKEKGK